MKEKETGSIDIEEYPSEVYKKMLFYMYSGIIPDVDEWGKELLNIAEKYQLQQLKMSIGEKLVSTINDDNCVEYLALGDLFNLKEMFTQLKEMLIVLWKVKIGRKTCKIYLLHLFWKS